MNEKGAKLLKLLRGPSVIGGRLRRGWCVARPCALISIPIDSVFSMGSNG